MTPQPNDQDNTTSSRAWRHAASVVPFLLATVILLSADLLTKSAAFDRVAGEPVSLSRDESGRPRQRAAGIGTTANRSGQRDRRPLHGAPPVKAPSRHLLFFASGGIKSAAHP